METETLTPEQVKAARALAAMSQADLALAAKVSASTVADFERGAREPMANNALAIREALESKGLRFVAGGVVERTLLPETPVTTGPGVLMRWVNATHLAQWGGTRDGQETMPELVARLIYAAHGPAVRLDFPAGDSIQRSGPDGVCLSAGDDGFVPAGRSIWEIGCQRDGIAGKATEDYKTRRNGGPGFDPAADTFVFVTPQRFNNKAAWIQARRAERAFADVRVIDADDLVHWLERYPAVAQWLAARIAVRPEGLRNLEETWEEWERSTRPSLGADVLLTGRDHDATAVMAWVQERADLMSVRAEAPEEGMAFLYAAIAQLPPAYRLAYLSACVVADDAATARDLVGVGSHLHVVLIDPDPGLARRLVAAGHHVFAIYGAGAGADGAQALTRPLTHDLEEALRRAGLDEQSAHQAARGAGRSITVLRRLLPAGPVREADWAKAPSPSLLAAMLAGGWWEESLADRAVLEDLAGRSYAEIEAELAPLAGFGGPLARSGDYWRVVSMRDLWAQLAPKLGQTQFERFVTAFLQVLGQADPAFDGEEPEDWDVRIKAERSRPSPVLRAGLAETLIAIGVYPERARLISRAEQRADEAVERLLVAADERVWWTLARDFRRLAEASPRRFLEAVEAGMQDRADGAPGPARILFRADEGMLSPVEYLSDLLWALEMLARSPDYLVQAALLLAYLTELDPPGRRNGNRPGASLRGLFLSWSPKTAASPAQRLRVIDRILKLHPQVGWSLLVGLAPRRHDASDLSPQPRWRDFGGDPPKVVPWDLYAAAVREIGQRLIALAGASVERWTQVLEHWGDFPTVWRQGAAEALARLAGGLTDETEIEALRKALAGFLATHREFAEAVWALPEDELVGVQTALDLLPAEAPIAVWRRSFMRNRSWALLDDEGRRALRAEQVEAANQLFVWNGPSEVLAFSDTVDLHGELGFAIARSQGSETAKTWLLKAFLTSADPGRAQAGYGMVAAVRDAGGEAAVRKLWQAAMDDGWGETAELRIVVELPPEPGLWAELDTRPDSLAAAYWRAIAAHVLPREPVELVVEKLIAAGRARHAVAWLDPHAADTPPAPAEVVIAALRAAVAQSFDDDSNSATMFAFHLGRHLKRLDVDPSVGEDRLVELEWAYYGALCYSDRPARTLQAALARQPEFFVQLLSLVFLPATQNGLEALAERDPERVKDMALQAYRVLGDWSRVPGSDPDGRIDGAALEAWVKTARKLCVQVDRVAIGDQKIGEILSAPPRVVGVPWPPEPVRDVIEVVRSRELERGFEVGVYNRRGATVRAAFAGGDLERALAKTYRQDAEALRFDWPRTAACLERIAEGYEADARRQDESAERREWL